MQFCCIRTAEGDLAAIHRDGTVFELRQALVAVGQSAPNLSALDVPSQIMTVLQSPQLATMVASVLDQLTGVPQASVRYGVPVSGPVIGVGRNYQDHVSEGGLPTGEYPKLFFNHPNALAAHGDDIVIPAMIRKTDWEAELGVVIGRRMHRVPAEQALEYVAGYLNVNDVSAREFQFDFGPAQTSFAKSMDGFCPCGPWLVSKDDIANCQDLVVRCEVNGQVKQEGNTAYMIYSVAQILSHISQFMTLEPGYLIATGTPHGVGHFMQPPEYLDDGDVVQVSVSGLGVLQNKFVREQL
jgi:2-keto-4-pentenoate hydratase/2-oxohepta-3-ene-1,7-dioic acid hydratase in catechol pathway